MAKTRALKITIQNQPGALAAIAKALGSAKVNTLALSGTAQGATGTVNLVAEVAKLAKKVLDEAKLAFQEIGVERHELANKPGALAQHLEKLVAKGVTLNSIHATVVEGGKKPVVVYAVEAQAKAGEAQAAAPPAWPGFTARPACSCRMDPIVLRPHRELQRVFVGKGPCLCPAGRPVLWSVAIGRGQEYEGSMPTGGAMAPPGTDTIVE